MSGWTKKYQADEPHSYQMHLLNYRSDAAPGEQHDGCVVETFARTKPSPILARYFPMTPRGFLLPDSEWIEGEHALQRAKRLVEQAYAARSHGLTDAEAIEYALSTEDDDLPLAE